MLPLLLTAPTRLNTQFTDVKCQFEVTKIVSYFRRRSGAECRTHEGDQDQWASTGPSISELRGAFTAIGVIVAARSAQPEPQSLN